MGAQTEDVWGEGGVASREDLPRVARFRTELRRFLSRTEQASREAGLTPQRYDLLLMIEAMSGASGVRLMELCEPLQLKQTAVTELVKRAVEAGLVESRPALDDRRGRLLTLTADGRRRLLRAFQSLADDRAALAAAFAELNARFQAATPEERAGR